MQCVSSQSIIDKSYHTKRSIDPKWDIAYASVLTNIESNIWSLSWSTLYLLMLYQNLVRYIRNFALDCMLNILVNHSSTHESIMTSTLRHIWNSSLVIYIYLQINDIDGNTQDIFLSSSHQHLKLTHGLQAISMKKPSYKTQWKY
jgi:hypothetical protein